MKKIKIVFFLILIILTKKKKPSILIITYFRDTWNMEKLSQIFYLKKIYSLFTPPIHAEEVIRTSDSNEKEKAINTINENIENFFFNRKVLYNSDIITKEAFIISIQRAEKKFVWKNC